MRSTPVLYQDFVGGVLTVLSPTSTPEQPYCPICGGLYGQAGLGVKTPLEYLGELPGAARKPFIQNVVEPVITTCGHTYCTFCISVWLMTHEPSNCLLCRREIVLPQGSRDWDDDTHMDADATGMDGLAISYRVSSHRSEEIYMILKLSTRELLTTKADMPFKLNVAAMIHDLPRLMITIARRFHYSSNHEVVPRDLSFMRLQSPMNRVINTSRAGTDELKYLLRSDAPLAKHPDTLKMYKTLCDRITALEGNVHDMGGQCYNWSIPSMWLYKPIKKELAEADGGIGKQKWWNYVQCVIKALLVWQGYCERAEQLSSAGCC